MWRRDMVRRCASRLGGKPFPKAPGRWNLPRSKSSPAGPRCRSVPPAAARPPSWGSSPGWNWPLPLAAGRSAAAVDGALRDRLRGELNGLLRALGITTIYVTHDQSEAMELGDRIVVMQKGAIAQIGTPRQIYFKPQSRFAAEFIGAANIIEAAVDHRHLLLPAGRLPIGSD